MTSSSATLGKRGGRRILVVDDEPGILQYIRRVLEHGNHTVLTSRSGEHAWGVVQRNQAELDLVLTDIIMPGSIDGRALAARIDRRYQKLPVLLMTGALAENDEHAVEMTQKGRLLRKPFFPRQLVEFIDSHFRESKAET